MAEKETDTKDLIAQCRWKLHVFREMFEGMGDTDNYQIASPVGFFKGMESLCKEMIDMLWEAEESVRG